MPLLQRRVCKPLVPAIGAEAGEVMTAVQTAMLAGLPYQRLRDAVIAHLTNGDR
jgi:alkylated DNA nucleotide flippase Atl1